MSQTETASEAVLAKQSGRIPRIPRTWRTLVSGFVLAILWEVFARLTPQYVAPTWAAIYKAALELEHSFLLVTGARVALALILSFLLGIAAAILIYTWPWLEGYAMPAIQVVMAVPVISWIIFAVLWFANVEYRIAFVLVIVCAPIFLVDVLSALKGIDKSRRDMVRSFRPSRVQYFRKLLLPATVPEILTSWRVNLSLAIRVVTIAELVGAVSGIGYGLVIAKELFDMADVFAWTLILVAMLMCMQAVLDRLERRLLAWRD